MSSEDDRPDGASVARAAGIRELTDARTMRALAHPVRIALLEELVLGGAMTATEVGERIGESPTTCSFHLRQLARYGFVEEAGGGKGRARPWRMTQIGLSFGSHPEDPEMDIAANVLARLWRERVLSRYQNWLETQPSYPEEWRRASFDSQYLFWLTPAELRELNQEMIDLLVPRMERLRDPSLRPPGSVPVEMLLFAFPVDTPEARSGPADQDGADQDGADQDGADQ